MKARVLLSGQSLSSPDLPVVAAAGLAISKLGLRNRVDCPEERQAARDESHRATDDEILDDAPPAAPRRPLAQVVRL
jgi:hypothetical protein